jgi:hypothetical protein
MSLTRHWSQRSWLSRIVLRAAHSAPAMIAAQFERWAEKMKYPIAIFLTLVALTSGCKPKTDSTQWIDPNKISQGPVIHERLSDTQIDRITRLQKVFSEVDPTPLAKWISDFSRDQNPDREIKIWEDMAAPFERFISKRELTAQAKKEAFQIVLMRSGASEEETLKSLKIKELTEADAKEILAGYSVEPAPIRVYQK